VISAFHRAAGRDAPQLGRAAFDVTVLRTGVVQVALSAASDPVSDWQQVALKVAEELKRSPPRIAASRAGVRMRVQVTAEQVMPNGVNLKELHGPRLEAVLPRLQSVEAAEGALADRNPVAGKDGVPPAQTHAISELPGVYVSQKGKVCGYRLGISPLGPVLQGMCDPSNIGVKPQRRIRATVQDEALF
jgi:hypothetical protein